MASVGLTGAKVKKGQAALIDWITANAMRLPLARMAIDFRIQRWAKPSTVFHLVYLYIDGPSTILGSQTARSPTALPSSM